MIPHHVVTGPADAPTLVLSNSLGSTLSMWSGCADALAERFRLVRYDTRGHGLSDVPPGPYSIDDVGNDLVELLDKLDVERVHVAGLSLGGMTGMWLAIHHPDRLDRLVVLCTSARLGPPEGWAERAALVREQGMAAVVEGSMGRWLTADFRARRPDAVQRLSAMLVSLDPEGYAGCCGVIETMDLTGELAGIRAPTLAIAGAQDPATPPEHLERIVAAIPGARLELLDPAAHLLAYERPADVTRLILDHLEA